MIPKARIAVVDDDKVALNAIVEALRKLSVACLPVLVKDAQPDLKKPLDNIQILFFDIGYLPGASPITTYDTAANIMEMVISDVNGPYILITWTSMGAIHDDFMDRLAQVHGNIPPPAVSFSLRKEKFIYANASNKYRHAQLAKEIENKINTYSQIQALMLWQEWADSASRDVCENILQFVDRGKRFSGNSSDTLKRILKAIVRQSVGADHAARDLLYAINEGLGPILLDRILHKSKPDRRITKIFKSAIPELEKRINLKKEEKYKLNSLHLYSFSGLEGIKPGDRGAVCTLPKAEYSTKKLYSRFGESKRQIYKRFISAKGDNNNPNWQKIYSICNLYLIGIDPACDQVNPKVKMDRVALVLECPNDIPGFKWVESRERIYNTPIYIKKDSDIFYKLVFNWLLVTTVSKHLWENSNVLFRLREPLINKINAEFARHAVRLGHIDFDQA